jgi:hypothetical protein
MMYSHNLEAKKVNVKHHEWNVCLECNEWQERKRLLERRCLAISRIVVAVPNYSCFLLDHLVH